MIPTAEKTFNKYYNLNTDEDGTPTMYMWEVEKALVEFAKLHVEAALKAASRNVRTKYSQTYPEGTEMRIIEYIDENSILNAYPLTNIK